jgi:hypothetical protein
MSVKNDNKGFLKEKLGAYRVDPPASVWSNISARIGGGNRRTIILITLATAATLALAISLGINYFGPGNRTDGPLSELQGEEQEAIRREALSEAKEETGQRESPQETAVPEIEAVPDSREEAGRKEPVERIPPVESRLKERVMVALEEQHAQEGGEVPMIPEATTNGEHIAAVKPGEGMVPESADAVNLDSPDQGDVSLVEPDVPMEPESTAVEKDTATKQRTVPVEVAGIEEIPVAEPFEMTGEAETDQSKWTLGAVISPLYSFRDAQMEALEAASDFESGVLAYAGGIQVSYRAAGRLSIESGLLYNKMGIDIGAPGIELFTARNAPSDFANVEGAGERSQWVAVSNSVGNIISKSGDIYVNNYKVNAYSGEAGSFQDYAAVETTDAEEGIRQYLEYLELPFNVRYTVVDRTLELQLIGGLSTNFLVNNSVTMDTPDGPEEIGYLSNIREVNYSGNAGLGILYHIHDRFSLRLEPRFRYFLHSVNDETLPSTRPYSVGFYTGLNYTF